LQANTYEYEKQTRYLYFFINCRMHIITKTRRIFSFLYIISDAKQFRVCTAKPCVHGNTARFN